MKKDAGLLAVVAAILAILGISNLPKSPSQSAPPTIQTTRGNKPPKGTSKPGPVPSSSCAEIQKRLKPFVTNASSAWRAPDSCYTDLNSLRDIANPQIPKMEYVIATAPNPISTHLAFLFDRIIEIIQQAAQDNNYSYDSSWLPWDESKEYIRFPDQVLAQDTLESQEKQPGLAVFRKGMKELGDSPYQGGLAIFIVAEMPTGGIDQSEFENALSWIQQLGGLSPGQGLKILGPTFSGSLPSLYKSIQSDKLRKFFSEKGKIRISSGSVSSDEQYEAFRWRLQKDELGDFSTAMESDSTLVDRFCQFITQRGYSTGRVAFLSEDETAFGGGTEEKLEAEAKNLGTHKLCNYEGSPIYLYYPRDIATLRSAYQQQSILNPMKQTIGSSNTASTTLRGDLSEPENSEHDTVRDYGGQLTPLVQEAVLTAITDVMKANEIQFVILRSSNSLDQIFLGQFLRRALPDVRVVFDGADLLFRRGAEGASLRGVMALSTYPLLTWQQDWTSSWMPQSNENYRKSSESYRIFGDDIAEGLYIAARGLLPDLDSQVRIANFAPPAWARSPENTPEDHRPATWLTVIGHRQFWPVAVLNSHTLCESQQKSILSSPCDQNCNLVSIAGESDPF